MRVAFPDDPGEPISHSEAVTLMNQADHWYRSHSYGTTSIATDVTPLLMLPHTKMWYSEGSVNTLRTDALLAALTAGFDGADYDLDIVRNSPLPGFNFSGTSNVGEKGLWLQSSHFGVLIHELGHNYGLEHANLWAGIGDSIIGPGNNQQYGNVFDTMGLPQADPTDFHFNVIWKNRLNWLPDTVVQPVTTNGVYRLWAFDVPTLQNGQTYALRIRKDAARDYWAEFRQNLTPNPYTQDGIILNWSVWSQSTRGTQLLDTTPGTGPGAEDAPLHIGRTFVDSDAGLHITPVATGIEGMNHWIDVQVNFGAFPGNLPPTLELTANITNVSAGIPLSFQVSASDLDGDTLAYSWEFGDESFGTNGPTASHSWVTAGEYLVRCRVSDMKGGTASQSVIVIVGSPGTYRISGIVSNAGLPVENVRISVPSGQMTYTDSHGRYSLLNLAGGIYSVAASLADYSFSNAPAANPVTVGPVPGVISFSAWPDPASIQSSPLNQIANAGNIALFTVVAGGAPPLGYQWLHDGVPISGATESSYRPTNVQIADEGGYSVVVTNSGASVTSIVATLTVNYGPVITSQPQSQIVTVGSNATFAVTANGGLPIVYQWFFNGFFPIAGATNSSLVITNVQDIDAGTYAVIVVNGDGFVPSSSANLTVNHPPVAGVDLIDSPSTSGTKVLISVLLSNDTDPDGNGLSFVSVSSTSTNGGSITRDANWIYYTPATGATNDDAFTYMVSDIHGAVATGTVLIQIKEQLPPAPNLRIIDQGNSSYLIKFDGIPGKTYRIEFKTTLSQPEWDPLGSAIADPSGIFQYIDTTTGASSRFYRSIYP